MTTELNKTAAAAAIAAVYPANSEDSINLKEKIDELKDTINSEADYFLYDIEYGSSDLRDSIFESADSQVDVYNSDLEKWFHDSPTSAQYMEECISEGLYDPKSEGYDFYRHLMCAQFMENERHIYDDLETVLLIYALTYVIKHFEKCAISSEQYTDIELLDFSDFDDTDSIEAAVNEIITPEEEETESEAL